MDELTQWNKETNRPWNWGNVRDRANPEDLLYPCRRRQFEKVFEAGADAVIPEAKAEGRRELISDLTLRNKYYRFGFEDGTLLVYKEDYQQLLKELPK